MTSRNDHRGTMTKPCDAQTPPRLVRVPAGAALYAKPRTCGYGFRLWNSLEKVPPGGTSFCSQFSSNLPWMNRVPWMYRTE